MLLTISTQLASPSPFPTLPLPHLNLETLLTQEIKIQAGHPRKLFAASETILEVSNFNRAVIDKRALT